MNEARDLAERTLNGRPLLECSHVDVGGDLRIWYVPNAGERMGFEFLAALWVSCNVGDPYWGPETEAEIIFGGIAFWDGVRHLWFGDDLLRARPDYVPYIYYPNTLELAAAFAALNGLERAFCREANGEEHL